MTKRGGVKSTVNGKPANLAVCSWGISAYDVKTKNQIMTAFTKSNEVKVGNITFTAKGFTKAVNSL